MSLTSRKAWTQFPLHPVSSSVVEILTWQILPDFSNRNEFNIPREIVWKEQDWLADLIEMWSQRYFNRGFFLERFFFFENFYLI